MRITTFSLILLLSGAGGAADKDTCFDCHTVMEGMSEVFKDAFIITTSRVAPPVMAAIPRRKTRTSR